MTPLELAAAVGEASLRAAFALVGALALRRSLAARSSADVRRVLLLAAVLAVPLLPLAEAALPDVRIGAPTTVDLPSGGIRIAAGGAGVDPRGGGALPVALRIVAGIWVVGAAVMLGRLGTGLARASRQARTARPVTDPAWLAARDDVAEALGARRVPELRVAATEIVPRAWGVVRPVVLLPPSAFGWSASRRRAVLAHEIGHLVRHEPLTRIAVEAVRSVHWFDPILRRAVARMRRESELAADEAVIAVGIDPAEYAGHLVALIRERLAPAPSRAVATFAATGEVETRVEALLSAGRLSRRPSRGGVAAVGVVVAAVLLGAVPRMVSFAELQAARFGISAELAGQIVDAARREGLDPALAFGLIAEESRFDPDRVSPAGAVGLTQVLPATAREVAPGVDAGALREVPVNLRVGLRYLRTQIDREGGDVTDALLAYSLGPGRLQELRASAAPIPTDYPARVLAHSN